MTPFTIEGLARKWAAEYWKSGNRLSVHDIVAAALREAMRGTA